MNYSERSLLVTAVGEDRTIVLPASIPSGATIGIVVLSNPPTQESSRKTRFKAALVEIEGAIVHSKNEPIAVTSDDEFNALIERARKDLSPFEC